MATPGAGLGRPVTDMPTAKPVCPKCGSVYEPGDTACGACGFTFSTETSVLPSGTLLHGRYEIIHLISQGGMGAVYLARDRNLFDRLCVAKQILEKVESAEHRRRLEEEALRMARLSHPGIAMILDHFVEDDQYFMVVEHVQGKTLSEAFKERRGQVDEAAVLGWAAAICMCWLIFTLRASCIGTSAPTTSCLPMTEA